MFRTWAYWQGVLLVAAMVALSSDILAGAIYWLVGIDHLHTITDPLWLSLVITLNWSPGLRLLRLWMRAHGYQRD